MTSMTNERIINTMTDQDLIDKGMTCAANLDVCTPMVSLLMKQLALRYAQAVKDREARR